MKKSRIAKLMMMSVVLSIFTGCSKDDVVEFKYEEKNIPPMITAEINNENGEMTLWANQPEKEKIKVGVTDIAGGYTSVYVDYNNSVVYRKANGEICEVSLNDGKSNVIASEDKQVRAGVVYQIIEGTSLCITNEGVRYFNGEEEKLIYEGKVKNASQINVDNIAILTEENKLMLWNGENIKEINEISSSIVELKNLLPQPSNNYIVYLQDPNQLVLYNIENGKKHLFQEDDYIRVCSDRGFIYKNANQIIYKDAESEEQTVVMDKLEAGESVNYLEYKDGYAYIQVINEEEYIKSEGRFYIYNMDKKELKEISEAKSGFIIKQDDTLGIQTTNGIYYELTKDTVKKLYSDIAYVYERDGVYITVNKERSSIEIGKEKIEGNFLGIDNKRVFYSKDNKSYYYDIEEQKSVEYGEGMPIKFGNVTVGV